METGRISGAGHGARRRRSAWVLPLLGANAALLLVLVLQPMPVMLGHFIYDDMFYYLRVAQHIAAGEGSTFDGTAPTNGYHPAWMAISALLALGLSGDGLVRALLLVGAALQIVQGAMLHRLLSRYTRPWVALSHTGFYLFNWRTISANLCGLETPLAVVTVLLVLSLLDRRQQCLGTPAQAAGLGALLGLCVLARMDLLLFSGLVLVWAWSTAILRDGAGAVRATALATVAGLVALAVIAPWIWASLSISGVPLPNSRVAVDLLATVQLDPNESGSLAADVKRQVAWALHLLPDLANFLGLWPSSGPSTMLSILPSVLAAAAVATILVATVRAGRSAPPIAILCVIFVVAHMGYYLIEHRMILRYVLPSLAGFVFLVGLAMERALTAPDAPRRRRRVMQRGLAVLFAVALVSGLDGWRKGHGATRYHAFHPLTLEAATWVSGAHPGAIVGAWNAGILSHFADAVVVNLDGVINDDALAAMQSRDIDAYIQSRGISLLVDVPGQISLNLGRFGGGGEAGPEVARFGREDGREVVVREAQPPS
ncbi:4-amino-4-deoxy-L-arabinose transferase-like glycosyltransferase [Aliiruegeria haliotis]|uniref:4-amino-4-deoxy-L-arabinose transferase-like glycosyltransferase n=1 Tax=Aliiruegeria haliotis TaxID=1280846 RepID=A0A2T0RZ50_9RHOB|nr:hypothetical protein [Aliiruegeria haliotis]PRY26455.1 4-amino-4-deoxy-L-arabinose transferase-like glycosyltransferase [Aliiruegeria haliotis]